MMKMVGGENDEFIVQIFCIIKILKNFISLAYVKSFYAEELFFSVSAL